MTASPLLVVVTDVDGTLVDHRSYGFEAALPALRLLQRERIPVVLCSSKTRAELRALQDRLGIAHPFVSENGGGLFVPDGYFPFAVHGARHVGNHQVIEFGRPRAEAVRALHAAAAALHVRVTGFSDMSAADIARRCGLSLADADLARQREYDEPFDVQDGDPVLRRRLYERLRRDGFRCTRGGRFAHVAGPTDKGRAAGVIRMLYRRATHRRVVTLGLGDALNDADLLRAVEVPIIVRNPAAGMTRRLRRAVPRARVSRRAGPDGWNDSVQEAVIELLTGRSGRPQPSRVDGQRPSVRRRAEGRPAGHQAPGTNRERGATAP